MTGKERLQNIRDEIISEMRRKRARCGQVCSCYNNEDRDCEIYGRTQPPSSCGFFINKEVQRRTKNERS